MMFINVNAAVSRFWGTAVRPRAICRHNASTEVPKRSCFGAQVIRMAATGGAGFREGGDNLSGGSITRVLDLSFRAAWVRLITKGIDSGYEESLRQFIMGCMAAYKAGYSLPALQLEIGVNELSRIKIGLDEEGVPRDAGDPNVKDVKEFDVGLRQQEKDTRRIWIILVYLTLEKYKYVRASAPPPLEYSARGTDKEQLVQGLSALVGTVVDAAKRGYTLQTLKLENLRNATELRELSPAEKSIRSQWMRLVFLTIDLIPDQYKIT